MSSDNRCWYLKFSPIPFLRVLTDRVTSCSKYARRQLTLGQIKYICGVVQQLLWLNINLNIIITEYISTACYVYTRYSMGIIFTLVLIVWNELTPGTEIISISLERSFPTENSVEPKNCTAQSLLHAKIFGINTLKWCKDDETELCRTFLFYWYTW